MRRKRTRHLQLAAGVATVLVALAHTAVCSAQMARPAGFAWGVWGEGAAIVASADFGSLPQVATCARPETRIASGSGWGVAGGFEAGWPRELAFGNGTWGGALVRLEVQHSSVAFEARERAGTVSDVSGALLPLIVAYETTVSQTELRIEPSFVYRPFAEASVELALGLAVFAPLAGTFEYRERLAEPAAAEFAGGGTEWNAQSGTLRGAGVHAGVALGLAAAVNLSPTLTMRPTLSGMFALNAPLRDAPWLPHSVRLGISFDWSSPTESTPIEEG